MENSQLQQKQAVHVDLDNIKSEQCGAKQDQQSYDQGGICTSTQFTKTFEYKRISKIVSPTGKEEMIEMTFTRCLKCGAVKTFK